MDDETVRGLHDPVFFHQLGGFGAVALTPDDRYAGYLLGVVSADSGSQPGWAADQLKLAALSTRAFHRTVRDSTHGSLVGDRDDAAESGRAIRDVVLGVRRETGA